MTKQQKRTDQKRLEDVRKQIALVEEQRESHRVNVDDAEKRYAQLRAWIIEREDAIRTMLVEIDAMPTKIVQSRSVIVRLDNTLSGLRASAEKIKTRTRLQKTLASTREKLAEMEREARA